MERDLDDVIRHSIDVRETRLASVTPAPSVLASTAARARRGRRRRAAGEVLGSVGVAAALVIALTLGGGHADPVPVVPPTPKPTPVPTPTPTSSPTPSSTPSPKPTRTLVAQPTKDELTAGLGLPVTVEPPDDIWDQTGEGWALGIYTPTWPVDADHAAMLRNSLVLASPDGTAYHVLDLPKNRSVELIRWEPGSMKALVTIATVHDGVTQTGVRGWLDLRSGTLTEDPGAVGKKDTDGWPPALRYLGLDHRGDEVWFVTYAQTGGGGPATIVVQRPDGALVRRIDLKSDFPSWGSSLLDPSGRLLAMRGHDEEEATYDVVDLETGREDAYAYGVKGQYCQVVGWSSKGEFLARCRDDSWSSTGWSTHIEGAGDALVEVRLDGDAPRKVGTLGDGDAAVQPWSGATLPDGRVVVGALAVGADDDSSCLAGEYALEGGKVTALPVQDVVRAQPVATLGDRLYSVTDVACSRGRGSGAQVESLEGEARTTLLAPPQATGSPLDGGLDTWVVAGGPSGHSWG